MELKKFLSRLLISIAFFYFSVLLFINYIKPLEYKSCALYTEEMNGGVKTFQGITYRIELCGLRGRIEPENAPKDEIRLRIFTSDDKLLAERYFAPLLGMGSPIAPLQFGDDYLAYDTKDQSPSKKVTIPPTKFDWLLSRLPRMLP